MQKIEILSPAGSYETLKTGVNAGADAIYIGGNMFSARASATNFDNEEIKNAIDYAHARDVRVYVAVNTLIKDTEMKECIDYLIYLYTIGADAFIIQDIGLVTLIRKILPDMTIHFSTQSSISSLADIRSLSHFDIQRIVLPRETNVDEISIISSKTNVELEAFVHGAICVSYSGRCLFSALNGGRSGNRGACVQACRKKYSLEIDKAIIDNKNNEYVLSPKDLKTSNQIDKIIDAGVTSLKIEGRMKRKEYIHVCVKSYKQIADEYVKYGKISEQNLQEVNYNLEKVFNRSFTNGYILGMKGKNIINNSYQKPLGEEIGKVLDYNAKSKKLKIKLYRDIQKADGLDIGENVGRIIHQNGDISYSANKNEIIYLDFIRNVEKNTIIHRTFDSAFENNLQEEQKNLKKIGLSAKITLKLGQNPKLELSQKNTIFPASKAETAKNDEKIYKTKTKIDFEIQESKNSPVNDETIIKQISKTDTFPYVIDDMTIEKDENIFMPVKILNELRRNALEDFTNSKKEYFRRDEKKYDENEFFIKSENKKSDIKLFVDIDDERYIDYLAKLDQVENIITSSISVYKKICELSKEKAVYKMPSVVREEDYDKIQNIIEKNNYPKTMFSSYYMTDVTNAHIANYHLNIYNSFTHNYYHEKNIYTLASLENIFANEDEYRYIKDKSKVIIPLYIYPELMITEFCPHKEENGSCKYHYKCKLPTTAIINEQGDRFLFEKFLNCKTAILSDAPYNLSNRKMNEYIQYGYSNFIIQIKNEDAKEIIQMYL